MGSKTLVYKLSIGDSAHDALALSPSWRKCLKECHVDIIVCWRLRRRQKGSMMH